MNRLKALPARLKLQLQKARVRWPAVDVVMQSAKTFSEKDGGSYAAALTYYMFFSIFPLLLFGAAILGFVTGGDEKLREEVLRAGLDSVPLLRDVLAPEGLGFIEERASSFAITGAVLALYSGTGAVVALEHALNHFHDAPAEPNWLQKRVRSLRFLAVFGAAAVLSVAFGGLAGFATDIFSPSEKVGGRVVDVSSTDDTSDPQTATIRVGKERPVTVEEGRAFGDGYLLNSVRGGCATVSYASERDTLCVTGGRGFTLAAAVGWTLGHVFGFLVGLFLFAAAYRFLPALRRSWRDVLPGAVIAAGVFEILKEVGTWYMERGTATREATFGAFALAAGLLVASYLVAQVTLMGAVINDVLMTRRITRQTYLTNPEEAPDGNDQTEN